MPDMATERQQRMKDRPEVGPLQSRGSNSTDLEGALAEPGLRELMNGSTLDFLT